MNGNKARILSLCTCNLSQLLSIVIFVGPIIELCEETFSIEPGLSLEFKINNKKINILLGSEFLFQYFLYVTLIVIPPM